MAEENLVLDNEQLTAKLLELEKRVEALERREAK